MPKVYQSTRGVEKFNNVGQSNITFDFDDRNEFKYMNRLIKPGTFKEVADPSYFCITANADSKIKFAINGTLTTTPVIEYSLDGGAWTTYTFGTDIDLANGKDVKFRGDNESWSKDSSNYIKLVDVSTTSNVSISGNIMTLLDKTGESLEIPSASCFNNLFNNCLAVTSAENLLLPATTLTQNCYAGMFRSCEELTKAPKLPALTLAEGCYMNMFYSCGLLETIPALPATTLAATCYQSMFQSSGEIYISATQEGEYTNTFTFGADPTGKATNMFKSTGGTFTSDPTGQTYYTSNTIVQ